MKIDHYTNPLGIVKKFDIIYDKEGDLRLEGRIMGITEEGFSEVNWYVIEIRYAKHNCEIGGDVNGYRQLKRGGPDLEQVEGSLKNWCRELGLEITEIDFSPEEFVYMDSPPKDVLALD